MNKIKTHEGGQPLFLDDVAFMDNAVRETFKGLLGMFGNTPGVYLTNLNVTREDPVQGVQVVRWDAGYIALDGEVVKVDAGEITVNPELPLYWHVETFQGENSERIFEDGIERACLEIRRATMDTEAVDGFPEIDIKNVNDTIHGMLVDRFEVKTRKIQIGEWYERCAGYMYYKDESGNARDFSIVLQAVCLTQIGSEELTTVVDGERIIREIPRLAGMLGVNDAYSGSACHIAPSGIITPYQAIVFGASDGKAYVALRKQDGTPLQSYTMGRIMINIKFL